MTLSAAVDEVEDLDRVPETVARVVPRLLGLTRCGLFVRDPGGRALVPSAAWGLVEGLRPAFLTLGGPPPISGVVQALESREPVVVGVATRPPRLPPGLAAALDIRSMLITPLVSRGRPIGVLTLDTPGVAHRFTVGRIALARALAAHAALALDLARVSADVERRRREAEIVAAFARALNASLDLDAVLQRVVEGARDLCGSDMARIALRDPGSPAMVLRHGVGTRRPGCEEPTQAGTGGGGEVLRTGRPFRTDDYAADPRVSADSVAVARAEGVVAELAVPIRTGGEIEGLLFVDNRSARPFGDRDEAVLLQLADHAAIAIRNARLHAETERRRSTAEVLAGVGRLPSETLEADVVARRIVDSVRLLLDAHSVTLYHLDPESSRLPKLAASGEALAGGMEVVAAALGARAPVATPDLLGDPRLAPPAEARGVLAASPFRAVLVVPLTAQDRVVGALAVADRTGRVFDGEALGLAQLCADQAAVALENARLFQEHERKLKELSILYELSRAVTGQLDVEPLLETVYRQVARVLDPRNMVVLLYDPDRQEFEVALRMFEGAVDANPLRRYRLGHGLMSRVVERRCPIRVADYAAACRAEGVLPVETSVALRHWLGVPMVAGDEILGVLALRDAVRPFTEADERLLTSIADVVALALRGARLFADRTRAHDELRAAQDQLIRSEKLRALGEMAAGVAHDFNNVLAAIVGRAQLLLNQVDDPGHRRQLQIIERAGMDGARTVRRIQEFSRMRRARPFEPVDLNQVLDEVVEITRSRWEDDALARGVSYEVRVEPTPLPPVAADPSELREVVANLVLNGLDAMPDGGRLTLRTGVEGDSVVCAVSDTGIGMTEEVRQRAFDPFFTTKAEKGTGLGLSVAYGIITRHGGEIEVRSQPWQGSTFTIRLPAVRESARRQIAREGVATGRTARVLVIDDEEAVRQVLAEALMARGHTVATYPDARTGLAGFHEQPFDVVFTDLGMPGLSGWEVARIVKLRRPETRVVLVTGWSDQIDTIEAQWRGVDFVVAKPFEIEEIHAVLGRALARTS